MNDRNFSGTAIDLLDRKVETFLPLAEVMDDVVWISDLELKLVFINKAIEKMVGFTPEERRQQSLSQRMTPDSLNTVSRILQQEIALEQTPGNNPDRSVTVEVEYYHKDGHTVWMENIIRAIRDDSNTIIGILGIARDICDRKKLEEALRRSETNYRELIDSSPDLLYRTDMNGIITFVSPSVYRLSGYTVEDALGMKMAEEVYAFPEEREAFIKELMHKGLVTNFQAQLRRKDGSVWWAATNAHFIHDPDGAIVGVEGITRDISKLKKAEAALRDSEEKFRLAFITSPDSINLNRASDGMYLDVNNGFCKLMGYARDQVIGRTSADIDIWVNPADRKALVAGLKKKGVVNNLEAEFRCSDGSIKIGLMSASLINIDQEDVILSITRDMTEQKRTREILVQSEKMLSVGGLAAGMAHEINNPLAGMMQNAQVVLRRVTESLPANTKAAEELGLSITAINDYMKKRNIIGLLTTIREAGERAKKIVENMLSFSRRSSEKFMPTSLPNLVDRTIALAESDYDLNKKYDFRNIEIVRSYDPDVPAVECDGNKIQQVVFNIIRNAADAMAEEKAAMTGGQGPEHPSKPSRITIRITRADNDRACIAIQDTGPGMEMETQKRVFEPFFTRKPGNRGTGLGLSVSYFIVTENHKGEIYVESQPGKGSTFSIKLPLRQKQQAPGGNPA